MRNIEVKLWHHIESDTWSIQIDGVLRANVSTATVDDLIEYAVVAAQQELLQQEMTPIEPDYRDAEPLRGA